MKLKSLLMLLCITAIFCLNSTKVSGQVETQPEVDHSYKPLKLSLSEDGKKYVRFIMWHQVWATTNNLSAEDADFSVTPSIRRSRFLAYAQVSPRFLILTHFGLNGLSPNNLTPLGTSSSNEVNADAPQLFLHDAWGEFMVGKGLYIGGGLHYWKGMTRLANQSTLNFMTLDQARPFVSWHSLGISDQFARHLGIYAKGQLGNFDYRVALNSPGRNPIGGGRDYGTKGSDLTYTGVSNPDRDGNLVGNSVIEGYFRYNFWDKESTKLPYAVGTYLGKKKVLGVGAGFFAHPKGMYSDTTATHSDVAHFAADVFLDMPTSTGGCLNAYLSFQNFDYGENYVSRWAGTGNVVYGHIGYYLGDQTKLMPYVAYQSGNWDGYDDPVSSLDVGVNYFVNGHFAKVTLEYHRIMNDPREGLVPGTDNDVLSQLRLQMHIFL